MQKTAPQSGFLPLITSPIQEIPISLVLALASLTLLLSTFSTLLCLQQVGPANLHKTPPAALAN
jgi:hypothetical protein